MMAVRFKKDDWASVMLPIKQSSIRKTYLFYLTYFNKSRMSLAGLPHDMSLYLTKIEPMCHYIGPYCFQELLIKPAWLTDHQPAGLVRTEVVPGKIYLSIFIFSSVTMNEWAGRRAWKTAAHVHLYSSSLFQFCQADLKVLSEQGIQAVGRFANDTRRNMKSLIKWCRLLHTVTVAPVWGLWHQQCSAFEKKEKKKEDKTDTQKSKTPYWQHH